MARKALHSYVYTTKSGTSYPVESGSYHGDWRIAACHVDADEPSVGPLRMVHLVPARGSRITHSIFDRVSQKWIRVGTDRF